MQSPAQQMCDFHRGEWIQAWGYLEFAGSELDVYSHSII